MKVPNFQKRTEKPSGSAGEKPDDEGDQVNHHELHRK